MPIEQEPMGGAPADIQAADAEVTAERQDTIASAAPQAREPLEPNRVSMLSQIVSQAMTDLAGGQIAAPPVVEVQGPVDVLPPELFAQVSAVGSLVEQHPDPAFDAYSFDPIEMSSTNAGLAEMANIIDNMASDKKILNLMKQPIPEEEAPVEEAEPAPPEDDGFDDVI